MILCMFTLEKEKLKEQKSDLWLLGLGIEGKIERGNWGI